MASNNTSEKDHAEMVLEKKQSTSSQVNYTTENAETEKFKKTSQNSNYTTEQTKVDIESAVYEFTDAKSPAAIVLDVAAIDGKPFFQRCKRFGW